MRQRPFFRLALMGTALPACVVLTAGPAFAASDVSVTNQETVQVHLDASGKVKDARVYEQLAFTGNGKVDVADPVSSKNLRNLDGFGGYEVKDGKLVTTVDVSGEKRLRTVSDFDKQLPLTVKATYLLDGKEVKPGDVVGRSGVLEVKYVVENVTGKASQVSFDDGTGQQVTKDVDVVIPMVGSLSTTLPSSFTDVTSAEANIAGDGRGGTKLSFTMTLFGPIGSPTASFGYKARISDGVVPAASISALPVSPLDSPSFKGGAASYKGGADTGLQLTAGATEIDANLLKLRDGAATLLAGLIQLRDGAAKLNDGLAGQAAPGAAKLADGAGQVSSGAGQLNDGLYKLNQGASKLDVGAGKLADGTGKLSAGAKDLAGGLKKLKSSLNDLPATIAEDPDFQTLVDTMDLLVEGIGDTTSDDSATVMGGLKKLGDGLAKIDAGLPRLKAGLSNDACDRTEPEDKDNPCGIKQVAQLISGQLSRGDAPPTSPILANLGTLSGELKGVGAKQAVQFLRGPSMLDCGKPSPLRALAAANPALADITMCTKVERSANLLSSPPPAIYATTVEPEVVDSVLKGLVDNVGDASSAGTAVYALKGIQKGVGGATVKDTLLFGLNEIDEGLGSPESPAETLQFGVTALRAGLFSKCSPKDRDFPDNCGISQVLQLVQAGTFTLVDSIAAGITGDPDFERLVKGGSTLADGVQSADDGAKQVADGAGQLSDGASTAADGTSKLSDGSDKLAKGARDLSSGLTDAANGSGDLSDGLTKAADAAPQLEDGAQRLSTEGTTKLVAAGKTTSADYGEKYALITAGAERAKTEGMAYGAPEGAAGGTAYSMELAGMNGEGGRNVGRGIGALVLFGLGAGAAATIRQRLA